MSKQPDQIIDDSEELEQEIEFRDPIKQLGFARIEHILTLDNKLSDGAFRMYALLHYFWQRNQAAWAGIETIAAALNIGEKTTRVRLAELTKSGLITRQRRFTRSSITFLEDLPERYKIAAARVLKKRSKKTTAFRSKTTAQSGRKLPHNQVKNDLREVELEEGEPKKEDTAPQSGAVPLKPPSNGNGKPHTQQQEVYEALVHVCLLPKALLQRSDNDGIKKMKSQVGKVASTLVGLGYTGAVVLSCYSRDGWWWKEHWQGRDKKEAPTLGGILKTIGEATTARPANESAWEDPQVVTREELERRRKAAAEEFDKLQSQGAAG